MAKKNKQIDKKDLKRFCIEINENKLNSVSTTIETSNGTIEISIDPTEPTTDCQSIEDMVYELMRKAYEQGKIDFKRQLRRMVF